MNPWLWDMGQAHVHEIAAEARRRQRRTSVELAGWQQRAGAANRWRTGGRPPNLLREMTSRPAPLWARASAWTGQRMIVCGCRLLRPALVADARSEM